MSKQARQPLFRLATASFKAHPWICVKICLVFACLSVLVCLFTAFTASIESRRTEIFAENTSSNYMYAPSDKTEWLEERGWTQFEKYFVERYNLGNLMKENVQADIPTVTTNYITLRVNGSTHFFDKNKTPELLWLYKGDPFNDLDRQEMLSRFGSEEIFTGRFPADNTNEVLISERLLDCYGLTSQDVLGKSVRILLGENGETEFDDLAVVGVISSRYYELSGHLDGGWQIAPSVVAAKNNSIPAVNAKIDLFYVYAFDGWLNASFDELNSVTENELTYCGIGSYGQRRFLDNIKTVVTDVYYIVGSILAAGLLLTVMLMIDKFAAVFGRTGGILLSCGLLRNNLRALLFVQILLLFFVAVPVALVGALVGYAVIVELVAAGTGISMSVSVPVLLELFALSVVVVFAAAAAFFGVTLFKIGKKSVKDLLNTEIK